METLQTNNQFLEADLTELTDWHEFKYHQGSGKSTSLLTLKDKSVGYISISKTINAQIDIRQPSMNWQSHLASDNSGKIRKDLSKYVNSQHLTSNLINLWVWEGRTEPLEVLFIDESDISLESFFTWNLSQIDDRWARSYDQLIYRLNSSPLVCFMGAQSNGIVSLMNERIIGRPHTFHENTYRDLEGKQCVLCDNQKQLRTLIERQLELRLSNREKHGGVYVASENTDLLSLLSSDWINRFPELKTKIVKKNDSLSNEELEILADPNKQQDWDLMLSSPKTKDGMHVIGGFGLVAGMYSGKAFLGDEEVINALLRVRTCKNFALHIANTKSVEKHLKSTDAFENPQAMLVAIGEKFKRTNRTTGEIERTDADLQLFTQFSELRKKEAKHGRKKTIPEKLEERGMNMTPFIGDISQTIPESKKTRENRLELVLEAKPYKINEWGEERDPHRQIHTEILRVYGEVNEENYKRWDGGNFAENSKRAQKLGLTELNGTPINEARVEVDKWQIENNKFMEAFIVARDKNGKYQIPRQVLYDSPMWKQLIENKDQWNTFFGRIGLTGIEIKDKHTNPDSNLGLDLYMRLLRKFNYTAELVEAKPQKAKTLTRQLAEPKYKSRLTEWRANGHPRQGLERFFWEKLITGEEVLSDITEEALTFLECFPYVLIHKDKLSHSNYIS